MFYFLFMESLELPCLPFCFPQLWFYDLFIVYFQCCFLLLLLLYYCSTKVEDEPVWVHLLTQFSAACCFLFISSAPLDLWLFLMVLTCFHSPHHYSSSMKPFLFPPHSWRSLLPFFICALFHVKLSFCLLLFCISFFWNICNSRAFVSIKVFSYLFWTCGYLILLIRIKYIYFFVLLFININQPGVYRWKLVSVSYRHLYCCFLVHKYSMSSS